MVFRETWLYGTGLLPLHFQKFMYVKEGVNNTSLKLC